MMIVQTGRKGYQLPDQSAHAGKFLSTDGARLLWAVPAPYIDGEVDTHADLPVTVDNPPIDSAYLVKNASGLWLINRKPAGIYIRTANAGALTDWTYAGEFPDVFSDANFAVYNDTDPTRKVNFSTGSIATGTTRTATWPDKSGTVAMTSDIPGAATESASGVVELATAAESRDASSAAAIAVTPSGLREFITSVRGIGFSFGSWTVAVTGSGSTFRGDYALVSSGATAGSTAILYVETNGAPGVNNRGIDWNKGLEVWALLNTENQTTNGIARFFVGKPSPPSYGALSSRGVALEVRNNALWGVAHNGSSLTEQNLNTTVTTSAAFSVRIRVLSGVVTWWVNNVQVGTTNNGPSGAIDSIRCIGIEAGNVSDSAAMRMDFRSPPLLRVW